MRIEKLINQSDDEIPVIAALPFSVSFDENEVIGEGIYNPELQLTHHLSNSYSTCREDESVIKIGLLSSKADTQRDD